LNSLMGGEALADSADVARLEGGTAENAEDAETPRRRSARVAGAQAGIDEGRFEPRMKTDNHR